MFTIVGALLIGLTLGLLGSGGSILTVPILVYMLGHQDKTAIAESLAIVGMISLIAMVPYARRDHVQWRTVVLFGIPGMLGTYIGASMAGFLAGAIQLLLFAFVMLVAAFFMFRKPRSTDNKAKVAKDETLAQPTNVWLIIAEGLAVGVLTGLVGVGGGFLIVPALVLLGGLSMRDAVGTSLVIIALKSSSGFIKYVAVLESVGQSVDWATIATFIAVGAVGTFVGSRIHQRVPQTMLRRAFAVFLLGMGVLILSRETPRLWTKADVARTPSVVEEPIAAPNLLSSRSLQHRGPHQCY
ncbi:MAG: sulfite exporter TauE/SafE family protein [Rubripirellula sp.]